MPKMQESLLEYPPARSGEGEGMTEIPEHEKFQALTALLDEMRALGIPFNAVVIPSGMHPSGSGDVAHLQLVDNATEWSACCEDGTYDIWQGDHLVAFDLSCSEAARRMVDEYQKAKMSKVMARLNTTLSRDENDD